MQNMLTDKSKNRNTIWYRNGKILGKKPNYLKKKLKILTIKKDINEKSKNGIEIFNGKIDNIFGKIENKQWKEA